MKKARLIQPNPLRSLWGRYLQFTSLQVQFRFFKQMGTA
jgi:hypothetical protein